MNPVQRSATGKLAPYKQIDLARKSVHFGPSLENKYPVPYEILNIVVISPEGGEYFNR
jgi:hypothetical protein